MATSTVRFAIIVALVVGGIVVIDQAFPEGGGSALPDGGSIATESPTPPSTPSPPPKEEPSPQIAGVLVAVFNGTEVTGLAAVTAERLEQKFGYVVPTLGDTPTKPVTVTTLYYRTAQDKVEAEALAAGFFKDIEADIQKLPPEVDVERSVQVVVYLGTDYAATRE